MEKAINRESVLRRTHWGVDIYAHILRQFYPGNPLGLSGPNHFDKQGILHVYLLDSTARVPNGNNIVGNILRYN